MLSESSSSIMGGEGTKEEGKEGGSAYPFAKVKWPARLKKDSDASVKALETKASNFLEKRGNVRTS